MKILRFLGVFAIIFAIHHVAYADCASGSWGSNNVCTLCSANPGNGYINSNELFNRVIGTCYKYCDNTCTDISSNSSIWQDYGLNGTIVLPFDSNANNHQIGFYAFDDDNPCTVGSGYCPVVATCSDDGESPSTDACKPGTKEVIFKTTDNSDIGTLYIVNQRMWSSKNTNFNDAGGYSGLVFPVFEAPLPQNLPQNAQFVGYSSDTDGNNMVITQRALTQQNAGVVAPMATGGSVTLYAQYEVVETTCNSGWYLLNGVCQECPKDTFPLSNAGSSSITDCFSQCEVRCKQEGCPEVGVSHVASCTYLNTNTVLDYGQLFYPGDGECVYDGRYSEDKDGIPNCTYTVTCETDYEWSNGACVSNAPQIYHVTLDTNGGYFDANGIADIYEQYGTGWSTSANGPFNLTSLNDARLPVREGHDFNGYATNQDGTGRH